RPVSHRTAPDFSPGLRTAAGNRPIWWEPSGMLPREEYYRPTRARDLRRTVEQLERGSRQLEHGSSALLKLFLGALPLLPLAVGASRSPDRVLVALAFASGLLVAAAAGETVLQCLLDRQIRRRRAEAESLEREHEGSVSG